MLSISGGQTGNHQFAPWVQIHPTNNAILTHWGRVTHICVGNLTIIGSDNGLSPERPQAIIWTKAGILLIGPLGKLQWNFNRNSNIFIEENTFENVVCEMLFISSWPQCVKENRHLKKKLAQKLYDENTWHLNISETKCNSVLCALDKLF